MQRRAPQHCIPRISLRVFSQIGTPNFPKSKLGRRPKNRERSVGRGRTRCRRVWLFAEGSERTSACQVGPCRDGLERHFPICDLFCLFCVFITQLIVSLAAPTWIHSDMEFHVEGKWHTKASPAFRGPSGRVASAWSSPCRAYPKAAPDPGLLFATGSIRGWSRFDRLISQLNAPKSSEQLEGVPISPPHGNPYGNIPMEIHKGTSRVYV